MPSSPTTPGNYIRCWNEAGKPADRFRAPKSWRTSPPLPSDTSIFRGSIVFLWSAIWTASYSQCLKSWPPERNQLSTGNRYFWHVRVNTPELAGFLWDIGRHVSIRDIPVKVAKARGTEHKGCRAIAAPAPL